MLLNHLIESRGVTAREPGQTYISDTNPKDVLTITDINVLPNDGRPAFDTKEEMSAALDQAIPSDETIINDNVETSATMAVIIASVFDANNKPQHHLRYIQQIPPTGVHKLWKTIKGYKFSQGAKEESVPIKPSDLIKDENYRTTDQLANDVKRGVEQQVKDTPAEALISVIDQAIQRARTGSTQPIENAAPYFNVLQKYSGEYLGPLALIDGGFTGGDTPKLLQTLGLNSFKGSKIMFPQNTTEELIDSIIELPNNQELKISSKIKKGGGAASSLSGIAKQLTPEIKNKFPIGSEIIELLGTQSAIQGPLKVALMFNIIDNDDVRALIDLDKTSKNIDDISSEKLRSMTRAQGTAPGTTERPDYRVVYHALTAIVNAMIPFVNENNEFKNAMMAALNNNNYLQLITAGKVKGDSVSLDYYTKFPAVFSGAPKLRNKTYFATDQKGRIGFTLK